MPSPVRIRRDVNSLAASDPVIRFYREAIGVMKNMPAQLSTPTSWRYQAAIHGYPNNISTTRIRLGLDAPGPGRDGADPNAVNTDIFPGDQDIFWRKCAHACWFFAPWHRMYLHFFEKTIMRIVAGLPGGPSDWALPYWNYSASSSAALLPAPFRNEFMDPAGTIPNHLFVRQRTPRANAGQPFLNLDAGGNPVPGNPQTRLDCLRRRPYAGNFGGPVGLQHDPGTSGELEAVPHNPVHSALGGGGGFMGLFSTAPLDPIFWLHHCNIDRLWEVWVQRQKQLGFLDRNPKTGGLAATGGWLDEPFDFHNESGSAVKMTSKEVLDTRLPPLSYEYDDTSDPFRGAPNL
ncbi:MAG: tyrosinase family protein [Bryobacteraceae bacterium]|nr:tyrosinase family protein [Bryobacteraceae bacterium]